MTHFDLNRLRVQRTNGKVVGLANTFLQYQSYLYIKFDLLHPVADSEGDNSIPTYVYHSKINKYDDNLYTNLSSHENLYQNVNQVGTKPSVNDI